jgi:hypothetical protein
MKKINTILFISAFLSLSCCELFTVEPQLPPITMEGKNTFGCVVNGRVWLPDGSKSIPAVLATYFSGPAQRRNLSFSARNVNNGSGFVFRVNNPILIDQNYVLTDTTTEVHYGTNSYGHIGCDYEDEHVVDGKLKILKFDLGESIVAGTFEFTSFNPTCGDTVKITEGRFDIVIEY